MEGSQLHTFRTARNWSGTTIVSIPAESVRQIGIEDGEKLEIELKKAENETAET
ncbi:MAG: AbrB/MazE/SpoVT family DNA-binding domain-containing protein [Candidatus Nanohaloarchaea archaeon]